MKLLLILFSACFGLSLAAQVYTVSLDVPIPDDGGTYYYDIEINDLPEVIDMSFGLERVCVNILHSWNADLQMWLEAPDGTIVELSTDNGGAEDNYSITCFSENGWLSILSGSAPYNGTFQPEGDLNAINNGQNPNGTWTLIIHDTFAFADSGHLIEWGMYFTDELINPEVDPYAFESSNLPLVYLYTNGNTIPDEPGVTIDMDVIDNGPGELNYTDGEATFTGQVDIETRGNSTQGFPKKSFGFDMLDEFGLDMDTTFLGMPQESDWILYAPYSEKALIQNALVMKLGSDMGRYNSRTRFCELFIDDVYGGVYLGMERIKRDNHRIDIADLNIEENEGDDLTGGYIVKVDWGDETGWYSNIPLLSNPNAYTHFQFVAPNPLDVTPQQQMYMRTYVDSFEYALASPDFYFGGKRYNEFIDLQSFIDNFIMNEVTKNVDAYRLSSYFYKDKDSNGGKLVAGPLWDFNLSCSNADYCNGQSTEGWMINDCGNEGGPFWWSRFTEDQVYLDSLKCRWDALRETILSFEYIDAVIDSMYLELDAAADRNFNRWQVLGTYVWPNSWPYATTFEEAIDQVKQFLHARITWMDDQIIGAPQCIPDIVNYSAMMEDFESGIFPPNCWTRIDGDSDGAQWNGNIPVAGYNSTHCAFSASFGSGENYPDNYLITPQLFPQSGEHLSFYIAGQAPGYSESYQVLVSTTGDELEDFTEIIWTDVAEGNTWNYRIIDLSAWWEQPIYIAFRHYNSAGNLQLRIDDVRYPSWMNEGQDCTISVDENDLSAIGLYPNPAQQTITIMGIQQPKLIRIVDTTGRLVVDQWSYNYMTSMDISTLSQGVYSIIVGDQALKMVKE